MLPHHPCQLPHLIPFLLPTESFCSGAREGTPEDGGQGALCLLSVAEWGITKLPTPPTAASSSSSSLCCQRVREAGSRLWKSCLGSSFICDSKEVGNKPRGMLALLPHTTTGIPSHGGTVSPRHPTLLFLMPSNDVTSRLHCLA